MRILYAMLPISILFSGCTVGFQSDSQLQNYIANLRLSDMSIERASKRLGDEGFKCTNNVGTRYQPRGSIMCHKGLEGTLASIVWLHPTLGNDNRCTVEAWQSALVKSDELVIDVR